MTEITDEEIAATPPRTASKVAQWMCANKSGWKHLPHGDRFLLDEIYWRFSQRAKDRS